MTRFTVLVTDYTWASTDPEAAVLAAVDASLLVAERGDEAELLELVGEADAILTCFKHVTEAVVRAGERLQVIGRYGIGTDNIAVATATELGIPVTNVPAYCADEVAEHVLAFVLAWQRGIVAYDGAVRRGDWTLATGLPLRRVAGRTLGIVGLGRTGRALAGRARGLGLHVLAAGPRLDPATAEAAGAEAVDLEQLAVRSDYVSLHLPLTAETRGLVDEAFLRRMREDALLVNCARGGIVDAEALARALRERWIGGAACDVFEPEHLPPEHPLLEAPNLLATPHVAFFSEESILDLETLAAANVAAILAGRRPAHCVNPQVLELPRWQHLADVGRRP